MAAPGIAVGQGDLAPWLESGVLLKEVGDIVLRVPFTAGVVPGSWAVDHVRKGDQGGIAESRLIVEDSVRTWTVRFRPQFNSIVVGATGASESDAAPLVPMFDDELHHVRFTVFTDGGDLKWIVYVDGQLARSATFGAASNGAPLRVKLSYIPDLTGGGLAFGHVAVWDSLHNLSTTPTAAEFTGAAFGHQGEPAGDRVARLCVEEGITLVNVGDLGDTVALGPQYPDGLVKILREAADADLAILGDDVENEDGLNFRPRKTLYNQDAALTLDYATGEVALPLEPALDDRTTRNDVTVTRRDGASHQETDEDSIAAIGRYDTQVTLNVANDGSLRNQAGWRLHLGTADADRFPRVTVDLDAHPELAAAVNAVRIGDRIDLVNLPDTIAAGGEATLLAQGWAETIGSHRRMVTFNTTPERPWRVTEAVSAAGSTVNKADSAASALTSTIDTTQTSISVTRQAGGALWTDANAEDGFDIDVGGERMTVTDISGTTSPQTFTVVRSVNGVVKSHPNGTRVRLWQTPRAGL